MCLCLFNYVCLACLVVVVINAITDIVVVAIICILYSKIVCSKTFDNYIIYIFSLRAHQNHFLEIPQDVVYLSYYQVIIQSSSSIHSLQAIARHSEHM